MLIDAELRVATAPEARQIDICFDPLAYSAFPHLADLGDGELLLAFRQAPRQEVIRHTHPRSVITVVRSYDWGQHWDLENATQLAAGGGQELGLLHLGGGVVGGALAKHGVVPTREGERAGFPPQPHEYPFGLNGGYWAVSRNWGLTWQIEDFRVVDLDAMPCAAPIRAANGDILLPAYGWSGQISVQSSVLYRSADEGESWSDPTVMALGTDARTYCEPGLVELAPGHLLCLHRIEDVTVGQRGIFWRTESHDNGATWSTPEETGILSGACPRPIRLADGRVLLTFGRRSTPCGIRAMLSEDGGRTWDDTAWVLRETPDADCGYSSTIPLPDGAMLTACYGKNAEGITGIFATRWRLP